MKVKKIHCLACNTILEADFDKGIYEVECGCDNKTHLSNTFRISQPGSRVYAIDKTKVKGQALEDSRDFKKDEWFYLSLPDTEDEPKYTKWRGKYGGDCPGFIEGVVVEFETEEPLTYNQCRTYLKTNIVEGVEGQINHVYKGMED